MSYESNYNRGYREGLAIADAEILENIINANFPNYYKKFKYKIRRLSNYEASILLHRLIENPDEKFIHEYIK